MKNEAMKDALKKMAMKHSMMKEGSPEEEASESPEYESKEQEELGLAPMVSGSKGKIAPDAKSLMGNPLVKGQVSPQVGGPMESGDAEVNGMKKFASYIPSQGNDSQSLGSKVKENIRKAIAAKSKK